MEVRICKEAGLRNDIQLVIGQNEIDDTLFHIANRKKFMDLPGLTRHEQVQEPELRRSVGLCKIEVEKHLQGLFEKGYQIMDSSGRSRRRIIVIGSRNTGNNHGFIAWQKDEMPHFFHIRNDPLNHQDYTCLVKKKNGFLSIRTLRFDNERVFDNSAELTPNLDWCVFGNQILKDGHLIDVEDHIDRYYDIRHILAIDRSTPAGMEIEKQIYQGYPIQFKENALKMLRDKGIPRNRYLHNCIGISNENVIILQREGTVEEMAYRLKKAGAVDGLILDNGGSVFCWAWWVNPQGPFPEKGFSKGGYLFSAPDFRPPSSAVIAFVLKGSAGTNLPGGSVSYSLT